MHLIFKAIISSDRVEIRKSIKNEIEQDSHLLGIKVNIPWDRYLSLFVSIASKTCIQVLDKALSLPRLIERKEKELLYISSSKNLYDSVNLFFKRNSVSGSEVDEIVNLINIQIKKNRSIISESNLALESNQKSFKKILQMVDVHFSGFRLNSNDWIFKLLKKFYSFRKSYIFAILFYDALGESSDINLETSANKKLKGMSEAFKASATLNRCIAPESLTFFVVNMLKGGELFKLEEGLLKKIAFYESEKNLLKEVKKIALRLKSIDSKNQSELLRGKLSSINNYQNKLDEEFDRESKSLVSLEIEAKNFNSDMNENIGFISCFREYIDNITFDLPVFHQFENIYHEFTQQYTHPFMECKSIKEMLASGTIIN